MNDDEGDICYHCPLCGEIFEPDEFTVDSAGREFCVDCKFPVDLFQVIEESFDKG